MKKMKFSPPKEFYIEEDVLMEDEIIGNIHDLTEEFQANIYIGENDAFYGVGFGKTRRKALKNAFKNAKDDISKRINDHKDWLNRIDKCKKKIKAAELLIMKKGK